MEIQYPKYFRVKATTIIPYGCGLISIDVKKYQQAFWRSCWDTVAIFFEPSSSSYQYPFFLQKK